MRVESGEAILGGGVGGGAGIGVKGTASPPLSAAVSQVSLAPSDLTTSDPDLAFSSSSSASSSRPPSSSQVTSTPDLTPVSSRPPSSSDHPLPTLEDYTTETVEFPTNPQALKAIAKKNGGVCFLESEESLSPSNFLTPNYRPSDLESSEDSPKPGFEVSSDLEEDYFEEFHLPNSHENAFVRHKSFRRKVNLTPINAPDAEKIEGLVRTGEFRRHGSIRRRIVSEESLIPESETTSQDTKLDDNKNVQEKDTVPVVGTFAEDLREIQSMLDDDGESVGDLSGMVEGVDTPLDNVTLAELKQTSTPKSNGYPSSSNYTTADTSCIVLEDTSNEESLSIEQSTLMKVQECLDFTKYKDIYILSGRLQDILTPKEIEEVLNNTERYSEYVNKEIIEALHNSLQDQNNIGNDYSDSGISSPKKVISVEGLEIDTAVKTDIRAIIDETPTEDADDSCSSKRSSLFVDEEDDEDERGFRLERRRSLRLGKKGNKELEVEGLFVESKTEDIGLKKIKAPTLSLSVNSGEGVNDESDHSSSEAQQDLPVEQRTEPQISDTSTCKEMERPPTPTVPDIVITEIGEEEKQNESNVSASIIESSELSGQMSNLEEENSEVCVSEEDRPKTLDFESLCQRRKISVTEDILRSPVDDDAISVASAFSQNSEAEDGEIVEECEAVPEFESSVPSNFKFPEVSSDPLPPPPPQMIPELTAMEESTEERHWRSVVIGGVWHRIDMKVIEPYRKCISHGGYIGEKKNAVIVISACKLPDRSRRDYNYVMDNLFLYVLSTLEQLIADDYILLYLAGGTPKTSMPSFHWLKRAYQMIDRKLRKNLKALHVVHPTFWVRAVVAFSRPFISTKFYRKLTFVNNLTELAQMVPLDQLEIPDAVKQADFELMIREKKRNVKRRSYSLVSR